MHVVEGKTLQNVTLTMCQSIDGNFEQVLECSKDPIIEQCDLHALTDCFIIRFQRLKSQCIDLSGIDETVWLQLKLCTIIY